MVAILVKFKQHYLSIFQNNDGVGEMEGKGDRSTHPEAWETVN